MAWDNGPSNIFRLTTKIDHVINSSENIPEDDQLEMNVAIISNMKDASRFRIVNVVDGLSAKWCLIPVSDELCLPKPCVVAQTKHQLEKAPTIVFLIRGGGRSWEKKTEGGREQMPKSSWEVLILRIKVKETKKKLHFMRIYWV